MIEINFQSVLSISDFFVNHRQEANQQGVYIWGFKHPKTDKFIPYYVGKAQRSVISRIRKHVKDLKSYHSTDIRLSYDYLFGDNPFYSDPLFPLLTEKDFQNKTKLPEWFADNYNYFKNDNRFIYMNNKEFINSFIVKREIDIGKQINEEPIPFKNNYPISNLYELSNNYGFVYNDPFIELIPDKMFICYAIISDSIFKEDDYKKISTSLELSGINRDKHRGTFFNVLETFIKYSLKGKTVSTSLLKSELLKYSTIIEVKISSTYKSLFDYLFVNSFIENRFTGY